MLKDVHERPMVASAKLPPAVTPGELLAGKYRVDHLLGEGGMGVVVGATNVGLAQRVAIKLLRPGALSNEEALGRFVREARAAASLRSEHVARVLDTGTLEDGRPYMVMEYLDGRDLGAVIEEDPPLSVHAAVDFVLQACEAIAEAHAAGIVHRDLKPKNLFLTTTAYGKPHIKVLDFGISKVEGPQELQLTRTTEVIGSPSYMSPEQLKSARNVDARTDIWALGVILYELLSKRLPFYANNVTELVAVVLTEREPPLETLRPDLPQGVTSAVARCLAKRSDERFQNVIELVAALEGYALPPNASASDRVRGVALASNRALPDVSTGPVTERAATGPGPFAPPPPNGAASAPGTGRTFAMAPTSAVPPTMGTPRMPMPLPVHAPAPSGATGVSWSETNGESSANRSRVATVLAVALVGLLVAGGAAGTAVWYVKRAHATEAASAPPEAAPVPLPSGRKDLPPLEAKAPPPVPPDPAPAATGAATSADPLPSTRLAPVSPPPTARTARPPPHPGSPAPKRGDDPLDNIGRR